MTCTQPSCVTRGLALFALATSALAPHALDAQPPSQQSGATVAVLYFTNSSLVRNADYAPLSKGIADMLITELAGNPAIRVVERDQLQKVLEEQNLATTDRVDKETAVRLGKLLNAHHLLMGGFVIDPKGRMRLDLRSVKTETSEVEYVETVSGKSENVLDLIAELGAKVNAGLRFPPIPPRAKPAGGPTAADKYRAFYLVSRSIEEQDRKNIPGALALLREALEVYPDYTRARVRLAMLEKQPAGSNE